MIEEMHLIADAFIKTNLPGYQRELCIEYQRQDGQSCRYTGPVKKELLRRCRQNGIVRREYHHCGRRLSDFHEEPPLPSLPTELDLHDHSA